MQSFWAAGSVATSNYQAQFILLTSGNTKQQTRWEIASTWRANLQVKDLYVYTISIYFGHLKKTWNETAIIDHAWGFF